MPWQVVMSSAGLITFVNRNTYSRRVPKVLLLTHTTWSTVQDQSIAPGRLPVCILATLCKTRRGTGVPYFIRSCAVYWRAIRRYDARWIFIASLSMVQVADTTRQTGACWRVTDSHISAIIFWAVTALTVHFTVDKTTSFTAWVSTRALVR